MDIVYSYAYTYAHTRIIAMIKWNIETTEIKLLSWDTQLSYPKRRFAGFNMIYTAPNLCVPKKKRNGSRSSSVSRAEIIGFQATEVSTLEQPDAWVRGSQRHAF